MVDQSTFFRYVHEVFAHLDDRPYLAAHPLASLLTGKGQAASPDTLRRVVLAAIDELRPPEGQPIGTATWRRWKSLTLRYVDGATTKQIAHQLQVSDRQALRDQLHGIEATAVVLWTRFSQQSPGKGKEPSSQARSRGAEDRPEARAGEEGLEIELARVAALPPGGATSVAEALEGTLVTVRRLVDERRARFEISIPSDLRPVALSPTVVRQALLCLTTAASIGEQEPTIRVEAGNTAGGVAVTFVVRSGKPRRSSTAGTSDDEVERLVDAARRLVEPEGGALRACPPVAGEQRMTLTLPTTRPRTVLVVDDNPDVAELFRWYLAGGGYYVVQARTPPTALELARTLAPDVITLDVMMPSQDGWQILQQLRDDPATAHLPVIVCSILPERALALALGVADFLAKPVTKASLLDALERCLGRPAVAERPGSSAGRSSSPRR